MKIAFFSDHFYPETGGIQDSILWLVEELGKRGHNIYCFAPEYSDKDYKLVNSPIVELEVGHNVHIYRFASFHYPGPSLQSRAVFPNPLHLAKLKELQPDIIHTHTFYGLGLEAIFLAKMLKVPIIGTNHMAITEFVHYTPIKTKWFMDIVSKYTTFYYNLCDLVTAPSLSVITDMKMNGFRKPYTVISNPTDIKTFHPVSQEIKAAYKKEFGLPFQTILYAGRLAAEKHIEVVIRSIKEVVDEIPQITLLIIGHGSALEALKTLVQKLNVETNVRFLHTVGKAQLAKLFCASDIFAIASTSETQSMTAIQAMACGLTIIGVNSRALPEYISTDRGFIVEPGNYKEMAEKIVFLCKNDDERDKMSKNSALFAMRYSGGIIADQWESIYRREIQNNNKNCVDFKYTHN